jgi:hypothetical protein
MKPNRKKLRVESLESRQMLATRAGFGTTGKARKLAGVSGVGLDRTQMGH